MLSLPYLKHEVICQALNKSLTIRLLNKLKMAKKIYQLVLNGDRVEMVKSFPDGSKLNVVTYPKSFKVPQKVTFTQENGENKTIRLLNASNEIDQDIQITKKFEANMKITKADRSLLEFRDGFLETEKANVQKYLDTAPFNEEFKGKRDRGVLVLYKEWKPQVERSKNLSTTKMQNKALAAMFDMDEATLDAKLIQIHGAHYQLPKMEDEEQRIEAKQEALVDAINTGIDVSEIVLAKDKEDDIEILLGKAKNAGVISFVESPDEIMIKRTIGGNFERLLKVSADTDEIQKIANYTDFLRTEEGKPQLKSIQEALKKFTAKDKKATEPPK